MFTFVVYVDYLKLKDIYCEFYFYNQYHLVAPHGSSQNAQKKKKN